MSEASATVMENFLYDAARNMNQHVKLGIQGRLTYWNCDLRLTAKESNQNQLLGSFSSFLFKFPAALPSLLLFPFYFYLLPFPLRSTSDFVPIRVNKGF